MGYVFVRVCEKKKTIGYLFPRNTNHGKLEPLGVDIDGMKTIRITSFCHKPPEFFLGALSASPYRAKFRRLSYYIHIRYYMVRIDDNRGIPAKETEW